MKLTIKEFLEVFNDFELLTPDADLEKEITVPELSRPGIELTGYTDFFPSYRIQLIGKQEVKYLESIGYNHEHVTRFLNSDIPIIIICRDLKVSDEFINLANNNGIPVVRTSEVTSKVQAQVFVYLEERLAPWKQIHGVCLSVHGTGIIITGKSGAGKSELALELINRGHFLVADDSVIMKFIDDDHIIASAPDILKNRLEIRGLGIIDVTKLYGVTRVLEKIDVHLIIEIKPYEGNEERIGLNILYEEIEGHKIPKIVIPMSPGRNLANLVETAVANFNLKTIHNFDSAKVFKDELSSKLKEQSNG